jgi:hypothetical protein
MEIWNNFPKSLHVSRKSLTIDSGVGVRITKDAILCKTSDKGVCIFLVPSLVISARNFDSGGVTHTVYRGVLRILSDRKLDPPDNAFCNRSLLSRISTPKR